MTRTFDDTDHYCFSKGIFNTNLPTFYRRMYRVYLVTIRRLNLRYIGQSVPGHMVRCSLTRRPCS